MAKDQASKDAQGAVEDAPAVVGAEQVQSRMDAAQAKGYFGERADPTPLDHYTVGGVLAGKPTPETDADAQAEALAANRYSHPAKEQA